MTEGESSATLVASLILAALLPGVWWYARAIRATRREEHHGVATEPYGLVEAAVAFFYIGWFLLLAFVEFTMKPDEPTSSAAGVSRDALLMNLGMSVGLLAFLLGAMKARGHSIVGLFGLGRVSFWKTVLLGFVYLLAAYPLVFLGSLLAAPLAGENPEKQAALQFFLDTPDAVDRLLIAVLAVVLAPVFEEVVFRGLFYGVMKRFAGAVPSAVLSAALFSVVHVYLPAVFAFFVLGLCLTVAYERTGSLSVPIVMHVLFNGTTLLIALYAPQVIGG